MERLRNAVATNPDVLLFDLDTKDEIPTPDPHNRHATERFKYGATTMRLLEEIASTIHRVNADLSDVPLSERLEQQLDRMRSNVALNGADIAADILASPDDFTRAGAQDEFKRIKLRSPELAQPILGYVQAAKDAVAPLQPPSQG